MIKEDRSDQDVNAIIAKAQAQIAAGQTTGSGSTTSTKTTTAKPVAVIAAPIPSKPAWQVPPSIVAHASSQVGFLGVIVFTDGQIHVRLHFNFLK